MKALEMVAPGSAVREGIDNIVHARTGGLIVIGDPDELAFLFSGGIKLDIDYTPQLLYQLAKMDGAIALNSPATKVAWANVQLMPDPTILTAETGTRHRTAERVSKQTSALVVAISQRREVVSLYVDGSKYILDEIPAVLAKANQALATLDKYRTRLDQVSTRLTALEFDLLRHFMRHPRQVFTRNQLLAAVWGSDAGSTSNLVDVYVGYLRAKLGEPRLLHTVRGVGYVLRQD